MREAPAVAMVRDRESLAQLVPQWEDLARQALEPNPLYEHWMLLPALRAAADVTCVAVHCGERLDGLFPLQKMARLNSLPVRGYRSWHHVSWMLGTPLVRARSARTTLKALLEWLAREGAAAMEFCYIPCDGAFHAALADVLSNHEATVVATQSFTRAMLMKDATAQAYIESVLSRESRKSLRRKEKRLAERGALTRVQLAAGEDPGRWIGDFLALEASGWKGKLGSALACSAAGRRFAEDMLRAASRLGRLQMLGLDLDGRPIARCVNLLAGEGSFAYRTAYDEEYAHYSPGIAVELDTVRAFHALPGVRWMDSITDPDNSTINRLWKDRRTVQNLAVGLGTWGETWVSMLPLMRWAKRRVTRASPHVRA